MIRFDESRETYDSTNPRFGIEYSNIRIRSNKNAVHCSPVKGYTNLISTVEGSATLFDKYLLNRLTTLLLVVTL